MLISQSKFDRKIIFSFSDNAVKYTIKDSNGSQSINYKYENIDLKNESEISVRNSLFINAGMVWLLFCLTQMFLRFYESKQIVSPLWLLPGILLIVFYYVNVIRYKSFPADDGNILIIENKDQNIIIEEIRKRRNKKLKERYFDIDFLNPIENEIAKYKWLEEENVISKDEFKAKVSELKIKFITSGFNVN
jgi:hypothetical protein